MASRVLVALRVAATPERAFAAFTDEIGKWWRPNGLFQFTPAGPGRMAFEPGPSGRLVERHAGGGEYEVGRITLWDPPAELAFQWRPASFLPEQVTQVHVRFEPVGEETRVVVACVLSGRERTIRSFGTMTDDLEALATWLEEGGIRGVSSIRAGIYR